MFVRNAINTCKIIQLCTKNSLRIPIASGASAPATTLSSLPLLNQAVNLDSMRQRNRQFSVSSTLRQQQEVNVTFIRASGEKIKTKGKVGDSLLDVVVNNSIDLDGFGACEGTLTCSTCHLILKQADYDKLPDKPSDEELDMLDLAYELTDTSRLGCQITLTKEMDGLEVHVPATINDARSV